MRLTSLVSSLPTAPSPILTTSFLEISSGGIPPSRETIWNSSRWIWTGCVHPPPDFRVQLSAVFCFGNARMTFGSKNSSLITQASSFVSNSHDLDLTVATRLGSARSVGGTWLRSATSPTTLNWTILVGAMILPVVPWPPSCSSRFWR